MDFGAVKGGKLTVEILHAPAVDSREAHITTSTKIASLKDGKYTLSVPRASGLGLTIKA